MRSSTTPCYVLKWVSQARWLVMKIDHRQMVVSFPNTDTSHNGLRPVVNQEIQVDRRVLVAKVHEGRGGDAIGRRSIES